MSATPLTLQELQRLARAGNGWAQQQLIKSRGAKAYVDPILTKYDADEERDDHGRWASSGGSDKEQSAASDKAWKASEKANTAESRLTENSGDKAYARVTELHAQAAIAHEAAARAAYANGDTYAAGEHAFSVDDHVAQASEHADTAQGFGATYGAVRAETAYDSVADLSDGIPQEVYDGY